MKTKCPSLTNSDRPYCIKRICKRKSKCPAVIAVDTLNSCVGFEAHAQILRHGDKVHAVTLYSGKGHRGFIDGIINREFDRDTDWSDVIDHVGGGPWAIYR